MSIKKLIALALLFPSIAFADDPFDFVVSGTDCRMLVSYNVISDESLKIAKADTPILFCK